MNELYFWAGFINFFVKTYPKTVIRSLRVPIFEVFYFSGKVMGRNKQHLLRSGF